MTFDPAIWLWVPFVLAVVSGLANQKAPTIVFLIVTAFAGMNMGRMEIFALASSFSVLLMAYYLPTLRKNESTLWMSYAVWPLIIAWCVLLSLHLVPGFDNLKVLDEVVAGPQSAPFSMYLNLDKPLIFFALLFAYPLLLGDKSQFRWKCALVTLLPLLFLLPVAVFLGALKPEFSLPSWWWIFALNNLLLTCVAEEALFRGFIQQSLSRRFNWRLGLIIASILFGLAHFGGGMLLMIFAGLAGLGYGLIFHFTQRLWCAVLVHFIFNFTHLLFFTYPILSR
jgi:membrane protease YdiL (CAAX protease family)